MVTTRFSRQAQSSCTLSTRLSLRQVPVDFLFLLPVATRVCAVAQVVDSSAMLASTQISQVARHTSPPWVAPTSSGRRSETKWPGARGAAASATRLAFLTTRRLQWPLTKLRQTQTCHHRSFGTTPAVAIQTSRLLAGKRLHIASLRVDRFRE